jgi:hypothetical protein
MGHSAGAVEGCMLACLEETESVEPNTRWTRD